tara:strand:+ start:1327 stop:1737 length:411 start_codon:yes stop_codon:yes gene_type:complete
MAKESGLGWSTASRDDAGGNVRALVADVTNVDFATPRNTQDITGMDKSAMERLLLLGDYSSTWTIVFNDAANEMHDVHKTATTADVVRTETLTISGQILTNEVILTDYVVSRAASGELVATCPAVLQDGTDPIWTT